MEDFEGCPDWYMIPTMNENVTHENQANRSPDKESSSSIEVIDEVNGRFNEAYGSSENLMETLSGIENMDGDYRYVSQQAETNNFDNFFSQQLTTEDIENAQAIGALNRKYQEVNKKRVTDSKNYSHSKKIKKEHLDKLGQKDMENLLTMFVVMLSFGYLVYMFISDISRGSDSKLTTTLMELKEENKLFREELSKFIQKENSTMDLMLQKFVEKLENQSLPGRKEFDVLKEQVNRVKIDIKMLQDLISGGGSNKPKLFSQEVLNSQGSIGHFSELISGLYKQVFPQNNESQEKLSDEKVSSSASASKPSKISETNPDEIKGIKKLKKDLKHVMSNCFSSFKSYGSQFVAFLQNVDQHFAELLSGKNSNVEVKKNMKMFRELLVKLQNTPECANVLKEKI